MSPALNAVDASGLREFLRTRDLTASRLPEHLWHPVVHEFTHHWQFFGPVGHALNVLYLKHCQQVVEAAVNEAPVEQLLALTRNALFVNNVVLACLKPIAEGLALFAEHDLEPSSEQVESSVLSWSRILFTDQSGLSGTSQDETMRQLDERMERFMRSVRLSVGGVDRKADLLAERFDEAATTLDAENDAWECYLGGYLYMKALQRAKLRADSRLFSGCLLMMLVETLIFNDYALVDVLLDSLDSKYSHTDVASRITNVINHRLRELLAGDLSAMLDEITARALGESTAGPAVPLPSGRLAPDLEDGTNLADRWHQGVARLAAETLALTSGSGANAEMARLVLQQREVFVLFRSEYKCVTRNGFLVPANERGEYQEFPLVSADEVSLAPDGASADAVFEVVVLPARWQLVAIHYVNDQFVSSMPLRVMRGLAEDAEVEDVISNRAAAVAEQRRLASTWANLGELVERTLDGVALRDAAQMVGRDFYQSNILRIALAMFLSGSGEGSKDMTDVLQDVDALRNRISFLDIAGPERLRKAATATLIAPFAVGREDVNTLLEAVGEQYEVDWRLDEVEADLLGPDASVLGRGVFDWRGELLLPWI
jgi:hypothetical protein